MQRRSYLGALLALAGRAAWPGGIMAVAGCTGSAAPDGLTGFEGITMGTGYSVRVAGTPVDVHALRLAVQTILDGVDGAMSTYKPDSELSRFNAARSPDWYPVSTNTAAVIEAAQLHGQLTGGAFDPSVAPLVDLWGFGPSGRSASLPAAASIANACEHVGLEHFAVRGSAAPAVYKAHPDLSLDLGGIAKGYAVDAVGHMLESAGLHDYLVEVGGEVRVCGHRPDGRRWRVGIRHPDGGGGDALLAVEPGAACVATSGDYMHFYEIGGTRYSHTIDPRDGRPVTHAGASVTVIAESTTDADALSTAFMVLGPDAGHALAVHLDAAAHFVSRGSGGLVQRTTVRFDEYVAG